MDTGQSGAGGRKRRKVFTAGHFQPDPEWKGGLVPAVFPTARKGLWGARQSQHKCFPGRDSPAPSYVGSLDMEALTSVVGHSDVWGLLGTASARSQCPVSLKSLFLFP